MALILCSSIYNVLREKGLCREFTFDRLFLSLSKLKSVCIDGQNILRPLTRQQKFCSKLSNCLCLWVNFFWNSGSNTTGTYSKTLIKLI